MFRRIINVIKSWLGFGLDNLENPELLLQQAQEEMRAAAARNRERAVQAITQKNNLQQMVDDLQKTVDNLQAKAELALKRGDRDLALQLLKEKQNYEQTLQSTRVQLESAIDTAEQVKVAIKREEEKIREKTAQALALKAQWKNSQIQIAMNKALEGIQGIDVDQTFDRAQAKIKNATSEMQARNELAKGRVENRIRDLEISQNDVNAEKELAELEMKMGMTSATKVAPTQTVTTESSDVMSELEKLEAKIGSSNSAGS